MDNQQVSSAFMEGWLVGVIDSEGWVVLKEGNKERGKKAKSFCPEIGFGSTCPETLDRAREFLKRLGLAFYQTPFYTWGPERKAIAQLRLEGMKRCKRFLDVFSPDMFTEKKGKLSVLKEYISLRLSMPRGVHDFPKEYNLWYRLKELNNHHTWKKLRNPRDYTPST